MINDTISDTLTRIRNSLLRHKGNVDVPYSRESENLLKVLKELSYIKDYRIFKEKNKSFKSINVELKYNTDNSSSIDHLIRVSKPGLRKYIKANDIKPVLGGMGASIISTSQGVVSGSEARKRKLGGELICIVY